MSRPLSLLLAGLFAWLAWAGTSSAQDFGRRGDRPGDFDFYVLALTWSPGFCDLDGDRTRNRRQCADGAGLGFVVHGLWPQYEQGYPSDCDFGSRSVPRFAMDQARGVYPDENLARYEWRKHGTCSGLSPADYFSDVRRARDKVAVPAAFGSATDDRRWTTLDIERAFAGANPGLRPDMMSVTCRRGMLQEVRICLTRDLRDFRSCPQVDRAGCRARDVTVVAPR